MNKYPIFLICFLLLLLPFVLDAQTTACGEKDYRCQMNELLAALKADPKNPENYYNFGRFYQKTGNHKEAIESFSMYILIPGLKTEYLADGYNNRGISHRKLGHADLAHADFAKAFELVPSNPAFVANRGNANLDLKKFDAAFADYGKAIAINPKFAPAYSGRGHLYMTMNKPDEAIQDFTKAIESDPADAESYYNRAVVFSSKREYRKAIADYDKYIPMTQRDPAYQADGYMNRGIAHATIANREQALQDFTKVIELQPERANGYKARAMIYRELKRDVLAEADEKKASQLDKP
jgi:tetratricopeptide (TPR) repeat protein